MQYAWKITKDLFDKDAPGNATGTIGPRNAPDELVAKLNAGEGVAFRLLDDDKEVYAEGRFITADDTYGGEEDFAPLEDFGTPNWGCTEIQYKNNSGAWETL